MKRIIGIAAIALLSFKAQSFTFTLSEREFQMWDERCRLAYAASGSGRSSGFYRNMTPQDNERAREFGEKAGGAWHYCAGLILLQRAAVSTGNEREGNLKRAVSEIGFTARKINSEHAWYTEIQVDMAKAFYLNGEKSEAYRHLRSLIQSHPSNSLPYTALAYYLKQDDKLQEAIDVLRGAPELLQQQSAELNYFLGWYLADAGKLDDAVTYARRAYQLNYPVPALRQKLQRLGRTI